ncbi:MAG: glycosyltransferase [Bacteroidota bacterium]
MPSKVPDMLILALARWDAPYSSTAFSLAKALSKKQRVFLIDNPFTWKDFLRNNNQPNIKRRKNAWFRGNDRVTTPLKDFPQLHICVAPLMLPINWLPKGKVYRFFARINQSRMKRFIRKIQQKEAIDSFHFLNIFNPFYPLTKKDLSGALSVSYYSVDKISESVYIHKHGSYLEQELLESMDQVLATSTSLKEELNKRSPTEVRFLPNAAETSFFQQAVEADFDRPAIFGEKDQPVVLYVGAIGLRIDFDLLDKVVQAYPHFRFIFIGPKGNQYDAKLEKYEQVHFTGAIPQGQLLPYFQHASAAIIPFKMNELTAAIYPLKIHEYLAAGLPVVSTSFSTDIHAFKDEIFLAENHFNFGKLLNKAIQEDTKSFRLKRSTASSMHSWDSRASEFMVFLDYFTLG